MDYEGPAKGLLLDVSGKAEVRGFIRNPHVMTEADSMEYACGNGATVTATKSENGKVLNSGQVKSAFITPASALSYFLSVSDQVETEIRSEILLQPEPSAPVRCAFAVMVQALPDCDLEFFNQMRERLLSEAAGRILADSTLFADRKLETLAMLLCESAKVPAMDIASAPEARFVCNCSTAKIWQTAMTMLGKDDFEKLLQENSDPVIRCQFCNREHRYRDFIAAK
jgi:molecular chaperone Hsp33